MDDIIKIERNIPIKIEENIAIPRKSLYPFNNMKVGDSFLVEIDDKAPNIKTLKTLIEAKRASVLESAKYYKRKNNDEFTICSRRVEGGIRFWRIK